MPWEFLTYGAEKAEVCERCQCLRFHMKAGPIHFLKFLFKGEWKTKTPECPGMSNNN